MKWGKKKKQAFSVLPSSWITKFKQMGINSGRNDPKLKQKGKWNSVPANSSSDCDGYGDGGAFWRLSFGEAEEKFGGLRSKSGAVFRYNSDDDGEFSPGVTEKVAEIRTTRLRVEKEEKFSKGSRRFFEEKQLEFDGRKDCCISPLNSRDPHLRKNEQFTAENRSNIFGEESFRKIKELKSRKDEHRKSLYISRELDRKMSKKNSKVRTYSPKTSSRAEICKIKAFEDMKKAKWNTKKRPKEKTMGGFTGLESFAVAKCSYDPQNDFRDSMIEMIEERGISKPEELEELLACYLTLNSDEYHDLIIRVFRQVWLDMSQPCFEFDSKLEK